MCACPKSRLRIQGRTVFASGGRRMCLRRGLRLRESALPGVTYQIHDGAMRGFDWTPASSTRCNGRPAHRFSIHSSPTESNSYKTRLCCRHLRPSGPGSPYKANVGVSSPSAPTDRTRTLSTCRATRAQLNERTSCHPRRTRGLGPAYVLREANRSPRERQCLRACPTAVELTSDLGEDSVGALLHEIDGDQRHGQAANLLVSFRANFVQVR